LSRQERGESFFGWFVPVGLKREELGGRAGALQAALVLDFAGEKFTSVELMYGMLCDLVPTTQSLVALLRAVVETLFCEYVLMRLAWP
jgi:hypothetical protein